MLYIVLLFIGQAVLGVQLLLCFKAKSATLKRLPLYGIGLLLVCAALAYWFGLGRQAGDLLPGDKLLALILLIITGVVAVGDGLGWLVYGLVRRPKKSE